MPELIRYFIRFAKAKIYRNGMISSRKLADRKCMVKLESQGKRANDKIIKVKEMKDFKAFEVSEILSQHELQIASILKRIDSLNQNLLLNERN